MLNLTHVDVHYELNIRINTTTIQTKRNERNKRKKRHKKYACVFDGEAMFLIDVISSWATFRFSSYLMCIQEALEIRKFFNFTCSFCAFSFNTFFVIPFAICTTLSVDFCNLKHNHEFLFHAFCATCDLFPLEYH